MLKIPVVAAFVCTVSFVALAEDWQIPPRKPDRVDVLTEISWEKAFAIGPMQTFGGVPASVIQPPLYDPLVVNTVQANAAKLAIDPLKSYLVDYTAGAGIMFMERFVIRFGVNVGMPTIPKVIAENGMSAAGSYRSKNWEGIGFVPEAEYRVGRFGILGGARIANYDYIVEEIHEHGRGEAFANLDRAPLDGVTSIYYYGGIRCCYQLFDDLPTVYAGIKVTFGVTTVRNTLLLQSQGAKIQPGKGVMASFDLVVGGPVKRFGRDPNY